MTFDAVGLYPYHCRLHAGMVGEVDVRRVTLGALPTGLVEVGERVAVEGRTADPSSPVQIERGTEDAFETVATATPNPDGTWQAEIIAERTAEYRARTGADVSETHRLLVSDRRVIVRARPRRVSVRVVPPNPFGRIALELRLRERFGWWQQELQAARLPVAGDIPGAPRRSRPRLAGGPGRLDAPGDQPGRPRSTKYPLAHRASGSPCAAPGATARTW